VNPEEEYPESNSDTIFCALRHPVSRSVTKLSSDARAISGFQGGCWVMELPLVPEHQQCAQIACNCLGLNDEVQGVAKKGKEKLKVTRKESS